MIKPKWNIRYWIKPILSNLLRLLFLAFLAYWINAFLFIIEFKVFWPKGIINPYASIKTDTQPITAVAYSPDYKLIATGNNESTINLWDTDSLKCLKTINPHDDRIEHIAVSPNLNYVLSHLGPERELLLWSVDEEKRIFNFGEKSRNHKFLCFSTDESKIAAIGFNDKMAIRIWSTENGNLVSEFIDLEFSEIEKKLHSMERFYPPHDYYFRFNKYFFTESDKSFVYLYQNQKNENGWIYIWNVNDGKILHKIPGRDFVVVSPDGKYLLTNFSEKEKRRTYQLYSLLSGSIIMKYPKYHYDKRYYFTFSPDSKYLLVNESYRPVKERGNLITTSHVYDLSTMDLVNIVPSGEKMSFTSDGRYLATIDASGSDYILKYYDVQSGLIVSAYDIFATEGVLAHNSDYTIAVTLNKEGAYHVVNMWTADRGQISISKDVKLIPLQANISLDGQRIALKYGNEASRYFNKTEFYIFSTKNGELIHSFKSANAGIKKLRFSSNGKYLLSIGNDHTARLINVSEGSLIRTIRDDDQPILDGTVLSDGRIITTGDKNVIEYFSDDYIRFEDYMFHNPEKRQFLNLGRQLELDKNKEIKIWSMETGELLDTIYTRNNFVRMLEISPNDDLLVYMRINMQDKAKGICLYGLEDKDLVRVLGGYYAGYDVSFSANNKYLILPDGKLYDIAKDEKRDVITLKWHSGRKAYLSDDERFYVLGGENRIRIFDVSKDKYEILISADKTTKSEGEFSSFAYNPEKNIVATGRENGTVNFWKIPERDVWNDILATRKNENLVPIGVWW